MCLKLPGAQFKRTKCALNYLALLLVSKSCFLASGLVGSEPETNYFANDANEAESRGEIKERNQIGVKLEFPRLENLFILKVCTYCIGIKE